MKTRLLIGILLPLLGLLSCAEDRPAPQVLKASEHNLHFSGNAGAWLLTVNSNTEWTVASDAEWCTVDKTAGVNTEKLVVSVDTNKTGAVRSTCLRLIGALDEVQITVEQDTMRGEFHYELPVVFHLIYDQEHEADTVQNIKGETILRMIEETNRLYGNSINSIDMNLELVPATHAPDGTPLAEPGIERVLRSVMSRFDAERFLSPENKDNADLMWDPNKYVNVYVFECTREDLAGISQLALTPPQNKLQGLNPNSQYYKEIPDFPWGIVINNKFIYEEDAYTTLAHELGHYLGLLHVFHEEDCSDAAGDDYCDDTPSYNRKEYMAALTPEMTPQERMQRTSCDGMPFTSYNIMDYDYSYSNRFTTDQYLRVRHVLENSPLVPGPKNISVTKAAGKEVETVITLME